MKDFFTFLLFLVGFVPVNFLVAQEVNEKPSIKNLWTNPEGVKHRVIQIKDDSVTIYNSDPSKYWLQYSKTYKFEESLTDKPESYGRIIYSKDSVEEKFYRAIDYSGLGFDSVAIFEHPGEKKSLNECAELKVVNAPDLIKYFYSTEYLNYLKLSRDAKELKKEEYLAFLKSVLEELKKPEASKMIASINGKTPEEKITNYFNQRIRLAPYNRKIFPGNLQKASLKYKTDENAKKALAQMRPFFVSKNADKNKQAKDQTPAKKTAANPASNKTNPTNPSKNPK
jgi:hypothetical protein